MILEAPTRTYCCKKNDILKNSEECTCEKCNPPTELTMPNDPHWTYNCDLCLKPHSNSLNPWAYTKKNNNVDTSKLQTKFVKIEQHNTLSDKIKRFIQKH